MQLERIIGWAGTALVVIAYDGTILPDASVEDVAKVLEERGIVI
jgi:hypothetical protein